MSPSSTIRTSDDASYLSPVENVLRGKGFKNNLIGNFSFFMRPPGYSILYFGFRTWLVEKQALYALKYFQICLFGVSVALFYLLLMEIQIPKKIAILVAFFYGSSGIASGFLFYTLTEAITPAMVIIYFYVLLKAWNSKQVTKKQKLYFLSFLIFGFIFLTRPVLGIFSIAIPFYLLWDSMVKRKQKVFYFSMFVILGFGPMLVWQIRSFQIADEIVGLHPIYSEENLQTPYRPIHQAFWEFAKSWGEEGTKFHSYTDAFWVSNYVDQPNSNSISILLKNIPPAVLNEVGKTRLKIAFDLYTKAISKQRNYFLSGLPSIKKKIDYEAKAIKLFKELTSEYRDKHFFKYHVILSLSVFKLLTFHSNLSMHIFQKTFRGNAIMEFWRFICFGFHAFVFLIMPFVLFLKNINKELKLVFFSGLVYVFYLIYFQRGIEERYTLPVFPIAILAFSFFISKISILFSTNSKFENR